MIDGRVYLVEVYGCWEGLGMCLLGCLGFLFIDVCRVLGDSEWIIEVSISLAGWKEYEVRDSRFYVWFLVFVGLGEVVGVVYF